MSLLFGKYIVDAIADNVVLSEKVGDRVYPIVIPEGTDYPFIVYNDSGSLPDYSKDGVCGEAVDCSFVIAAKKYDEAVSVAQEVRNTFEGKTAEYDEFWVSDCTMDSWSKDYNDDLPAYTVSLNLSFKLN